MGSFKLLLWAHYGRRYWYSIMANASAQSLAVVASTDLAGQHVETLQESSNSNPSTSSHRINTSVLPTYDHLYNNELCCITPPWTLQYASEDCGRRPAEIPRKDMQRRRSFLGVCGRWEDVPSRIF